jgi:hypothetical protein
MNLVLRIVWLIIVRFVFIRFNKPQKQRKQHCQQHNKIEIHRPFLSLQSYCYAQLPEHFSTNIRMFHFPMQIDN